MLRTVLAIAVAALSLLSLASYDAYAEIYMKIDTIKGDVTAQGFQNDILLSGFHFGAGRQISSPITGQREAGVPTLSDLVVEKQMDVSSSPLLSNLLAGKSLPTVEILLTKVANGKQFTYNDITLSNVILSSYSVSSGGETPAESFGLNYEKISTSFTQQNPDGTAGQTIKSCWDVSTEKVCSTSASPDTVPPVTTVTPTGASGANGWFVSPVSITLSAQDNSGGSGVKSTTYSIDGAGQTAYSAPFTVTGDGNHTITFNSTDNAGNQEPVHTIYIPIDSSPPAISVPANVTQEATGPQTIVSLGTANATDAVDGPVTVTNNATSTYQVGNTIIQYQATDLAGNTAFAYQDVTITDTTPPTLSLPVQVMAQATGPSGAAVNYTANATDLVDGPVTPVCTPPSGSVFAFGLDTVTCTATDAHNNKATGTFNVDIINKIPPTITISSPSNSAIINTATVAVNGNATDIVAVSAVSWKVDNGIVSTVSGLTPAPSLNWSFTTGSLALGQHVIQVNATDSAGLVTISQITITYAAPTVSIPSPSGSGQITFGAGSGGFTSLNTVAPSSFPTPPPPGSYPLGFFSWSITGFAPATSAAVTISSPVPLQAQSQYFKLIGGTWIGIPVAVHGSTITFTISDNGPFDNNPATGTISDPGAVANPTDGKVTGGGNIGKGTNFAFEATSDLDKAKAIRGTLEYQDKYVKLNLHSNSVSFLSVDTTTSKATITGTTSYERHDRHAGHGAAYSFLATISDPDKTGYHDTFSITISNSTGSIVYQNSGVVKGHIEIHKFADREDKSDSGIKPNPDGKNPGKGSK